MGFIASFFAFMLCCGGLVALTTRRCCNMAWKTDSVLKLGRIHRYFAYALIIFSQVVITTGIIWYFDRTKAIFKGILCAALNLGAFVIPILIGEILHRRKLQQFEAFNKLPTSMSQNEFNSLLKEGRKLVILDELVLDLSPFISRHPGGRFVLEHNVGRDISKFFHGGYSLDGNSGSNPAKGHRHSNYARIIVNQLACATFEKG